VGLILSRNVYSSNNSKDTTETDIEDIIFGVISRHQAKGH